MKKLLTALSLGLSLALLVLPLGAVAQSYPSRPIKLVVTYATGGITDIIARSVAAKMSVSLGQPIVVENKTGASGNIGGEAVVRAPADGYTLLLGASGPLAVNPSLMASMPFDPVKDLTPIGLLATSPGVLVVGPQVPANNVKDLIALVRSSPGKFSYASSGNGGIPHLSGEQFKMMTGLDITHIPYRGDAPAINDVMGGQVQIGFPAPGSALPLIKAGRVKALGVGAAARTAALPDVPTISEAGVPGYALIGWFSIFGPAGTPGDIVKRLNVEMRKALDDPQIRRQFLDLGIDAAEPMSPEQFGQFHKAEIAKFSKLVRSANIKLENQ